MADEQRSHDDLTEEASSFRLDELRSKGQVAQSRELVSVIALCVAGVAFMSLMPAFVSAWQEFAQSLFLIAPVNLSGNSLGAQLIPFDSALSQKVLIFLSLGIFPVCLTAFFAGILGSLVQVGPLFTLEPLAWDLNRIDPVAGFKRLFSVRVMIETIKIIGKVTVLGTVLWFALKPRALQSGILLFVSLGDFGKLTANMMEQLFFSCVFVLFVFSGVDVWLVRREYSKSSRLTKQEAKQESKEREGDPQVKARIRALQRQLARRRMMQAVKKADVIITNPTHIAVAIVYQSMKMKAPLVVAKGADLLAQRIKLMAKQTGIPCVENVPLARELYKKVRIGAFIPKHLYQTVAEVLAYVYRLNKAAGKGFFEGKPQ
jgi:flagellar biosynthetic protein FlhB